MSKSLEELHQDLEKCSDFDINNNTEKFLDTIDQIVSKQDSSSIAKILKYFDDNSEYGWVMESMSKAIEHFEKQTYVQEILKNLQIFDTRSQDWLLILCFRIFNHHLYFDIFRQNMHLASKESLLKLFDLMEQESPHHIEIIKELRAELGKSSK